MPLPIGLIFLIASIVGMSIYTECLENFQHLLQLLLSLEWQWHYSEQPTLLNKLLHRAIIIRLNVYLNFSVSLPNRSLPWRILLTHKQWAFRVFASTEAAIPMVHNNFVCHVQCQGRGSYYARFGGRLRLNRPCNSSEWVLLLDIEHSSEMD